jgi:hypothetical protein
MTNNRTRLSGIRISSGRNSIFLRTVSRRKRTNCLAACSAFNGVISGRLTIYSPMNDGTSIIRLQQAKARNTANKIATSRAPTAMPLDATRLKI